jgi:pilus assembly protein CpaD
MEKRVMSAFVKRPGEQSSAVRPVAALFSLLLSSASLAGCMQGPRFEAPFMLGNPNENHPVLVSRQDTQLDIAVYPNSYGLSARDQARLYNFLQGFSADKGSLLVIRAPSGGVNERAAMRVFGDLRQYLKNRGFTADMVRLETYYSGYRTAPIKLSYRHYVAKGPDCPDWSENVGRDPENMPYPNLGCATQANLAAAVADPQDLIQPRAETPRSGERRDVVWGKYVNGEPTGANWRPQPLPERAGSTDTSQ